MDGQASAEPSAYVRVMGQGHVVDAVLTTLLVLGIVGGNVYFWVLDWRARRQKEAAAAAGEAEAPRPEEAAQAALAVEAPADVEVAIAVPDAPKAPRPRLLYLDNMRSALTVLVLVHHVVCIWYVGKCHFYGPIFYVEPVWTVVASVFLGVNQAYFMSAFMFLSGYFVPVSFDKKGCAIFLRDRLRRLGLPLLFSSFVLTPGIAMLVSNSPRAFYAGLAPPVRYEYQPGQMWFVQWLLVFNVAYALVALDTKGRTPLAIRLPPLTAWLALGILLGLVNGLVYYSPQATTSWWWCGTMYMPFLIPYCVWFTLGVLAKRGDWLHQLQQWSPAKKATTYALAALAFVLACTFLVISSTALYPNPEDRPISSLGVKSELGATLLVTTFLNGFWHVTAILSLFLFFGDFVNFSGRFCRFMADASYSAYILHTWFLVPVAFAFVKILAAAGQPLAYGLIIDSAAALSSYWLVVAGAVWTTFLAIPACYLVSWGLAKLPGLREVL